LYWWSHSIIVCFLNSSWMSDYYGLWGRFLVAFERLLFRYFMYKLHLMSHLYYSFLLSIDMFWGWKTFWEFLRYFTQLCGYDRVLMSNLLLLCFLCYSNPNSNYLDPHNPPMSRSFITLVSIFSSILIEIHS